MGYLKASMVEIELDGKAVEVPQGSMVMHAANKLGTYVPHFCYYKKLSIAANCRMCLVEVEKAPKPLPACATPVTQGMKVFTHSAKAVEAQRSVMEFLLINHPLTAQFATKVVSVSYKIWLLDTGNQTLATTKKSALFSIRMLDR